MNLGVAEAHNLGLRLARQRGHRAVLLLEDREASSRLFRELAAAFGQEAYVVADEVALGATEIDIDRRWAVDVAQRTTLWAEEVVSMDGDTLPDGS